MKIKTNPLFAACAVGLLLIAGCATSSKIVTGTARPAVDPEAVKVYSSPPPAAFEEIAILTARGGTSFSNQAGRDSAVRKLRVEAAKLGANGIIITESTGTVWSGNDVSAKAILTASPPK